MGIYAASGIALIGGSIAFGLSGVGLPISIALVAAAIKMFIVGAGLIAGTSFFLYGGGGIIKNVGESIPVFNKTSPSKH